MPEEFRNQTPWLKGYDLAKYPGKVHADGVQAMVDAVNLPGTGEIYRKRLEAVLDVDNWLKTYAVEHAVGERFPALDGDALARLWHGGAAAHRGTLDDHALVATAMLDPFRDAPTLSFFANILLTDERRSSFALSAFAYSASASSASARPRCSRPARAPWGLPRASALPT